MTEIKRGSMIMIKKGTKIRTTKAPYDKVAGRDYVVKAFDTREPIRISCSMALNDRDYRNQLEAQGFDFSELEKLRAENSMEWYTRMVPIGEAKVVWVGAGGYWHEAKISDVEYMGEAA